MAKSAREIDYSGVADRFLTEFSNTIASEFDDEGFTTSLVTQIADTGDSAVTPIRVTKIYGYSDDLIYVESDDDIISEEFSIDINDGDRYELTFDDGSRFWVTYNGLWKIRAISKEAQARSVNTFWAFEPDSIAYSDIVELISNTSQVTGQLLKRKEKTS